MRVTESKPDFQLTTITLNTKLDLEIVEHLIGCTCGQDIIRALNKGEEFDKKIIKTQQVLYDDLNEILERLNK